MTSWREAFLTLEVQQEPCDHPFAIRTIRLSQNKSKLAIGRASKRDAAISCAKDNALFDNQVMSRHHGQIEADLEHKKLYIRDTDSLHGIAVNDVVLKSHEPRLLLNGDVITFGAAVNRNSVTFTPCRVIAFIAFIEQSSMPFTITVPDDSDDDCTDSSTESIMEVVRACKGRGLEPNSIDLTSEERIDDVMDTKSHGKSLGEIIHIDSDHHIESDHHTESDQLTQSDRSTEGDQPTDSDQPIKRQQPIAHCSQIGGRGQDGNGASSTSTRECQAYPISGDACASAALVCGQSHSRASPWPQQIFQSVKADVRDYQHHQGELFIDEESIRADRYQLHMPAATLEYPYSAGRKIDPDVDCCDAGHSDTAVDLAAGNQSHLSSKNPDDQCSVSHPESPLSYASIGPQQIHTVDWLSQIEESPIYGNSLLSQTMEWQRSVPLMHGDIMHPFPSEASFAKAMQAESAVSIWESSENRFSRSPVLTPNSSRESSPELDMTLALICNEAADILAGASLGVGNQILDDSSGSKRKVSEMEEVVCTEEANPVSAEIGVDDVASMGAKIEDAHLIQQETRCGGREFRPLKKLRRVAEAVGFIALGGAALFSTLVVTAPSL